MFLRYHHSETIDRPQPLTFRFFPPSSPPTELIPKEHWAVPSWINNDLFKESAQMLKEQDIQYGNLVSYHQMCRWNSGLFYHHPALAHTRYYWRVEPKVHFFCDVDYDVFRYMADRNKTYGFTINLYDAPQSIPTLWPETLKFLAAHPEHESTNNARDWLEDSTRRPDHNIKANGYSTCHFWSNFEIADMAFWRSRAYEDYFEHLDRAGGFFYERWGDAPVHSIALGLFEDASKIHWSRSPPIFPFLFPKFFLFCFPKVNILLTPCPHSPGSATSATSTSPTSTAPTRPNAKDAAPAASPTARNSSSRRIAGPIGSSSSAWRENQG